MRLSRGEHGQWSVVRVNLELTLIARYGRLGTGWWCDTGDTLHLVSPSHVASPGLRVDACQAGRVLQPAKRRQEFSGTLRKPAKLSPPTSGRISHLGGHPLAWHDSCACQAGHLFQSSGTRAGWTWGRRQGAGRG